MRKRDASLLAQIENDVLSDRPLADTLRKCVVLGGQAGSRNLREWASRELKGYAADDEVPEYRTVGAPILADAALPFGGYVKKQRIGTMALPEFVRDHVDEMFTFRDGIGQLEALIRRSRDEEGVVHLSLPSAPELAQYMNQKIGDEFQAITALYWSVDVAALEGIVDQVRTTLAELVAEMRAGVPDDTEVPSGAVADQAVNVAVNGDRSTVTITAAQASGGSEATLTTRASEDGRSVPGWWTRSRIVGAGAAGLASILGLAFAVSQWRGWI